MDQQNQPSGPSTPPPGEGQAIVSLVFGIISLVVYFTNWLVPFAEVFIGIVGIIFAISAKNRGFSGGKATAGLICSVIAVVLGGLYWIACVMCLVSL